MKSAGVAVVLSFFLPGLGSLYAEAYVNAFVLMLFWVLSLILAVPTCGILPVFTWIVGMAAAHNTAQAYNQTYTTQQGKRVGR